MPPLTHRFIKNSLAMVSGLLLLMTSLWADLGVSTLDGNFKALALSGDRIVAIDLSGDDREISTSDDDGVSFTSRHIAEDNYEALGAVGTTVIAVGNSGLILRSADSGSTWSSVSTSALWGSLRSVAGRTDGANANQWLAVGDDGTNGSVYRSTDDGLSWAEVEEISELLIEDVIWTGSRWVLCGGGAFFYEGSIYSSTDGLNWSASTVPFGVSPLLAMGHDGAGVVVAVGEQGQVLRSTDDGLTFTAVATDLSSEDLNAVIVDSSGTFYLGGNEKMIIELNGTSGSFLIPATPGAAPVLDFVLIDDAPVATGAFDDVAARTIPLDLLISVEGTLDYRLSVSQSLTGKAYILETSTDLVDWDPLPTTSQMGPESSIFFDVSEDELKRFWRVVEF